MTAAVQLDHLWVRFGQFVAVKDVDLTIAGGEFFSFLGPSGCGKTTLLRAISGFQNPSQGRVLIGGQDMAGIGPNRRPTALIFQNLALFPLMTVWENITFALEVKGVDKTARRKRADELLELIALPGQGDKRVGELSGGQRQRIAIARALAAEPQVLLLDEPLSALDLKLRQHMRTELRAIQRQVGLTFIYITHDQGEALTMSDRVAVMDAGVIEQVADGNTLYNRPRTAFVASFVGENNALYGKVDSIDSAEGTATVVTELGPLLARLGEGLTTGSEAIVFVRPESVAVLNGRTENENTPNQLQVTLEKQEFEGNLWHLALRTDAGPSLNMTRVNAGSGPQHRPGERFSIGFAPRLAVALPKQDLAKAD